MLPIIVSGIQPTGNLHVGNYLGAIRNWVDLQNSGKYQLYFFIADWHALTGKMSAEELHKQNQITVAELLAIGIDPSKVVFFRQSDIKEHTELTWIFNCATPIAELYRMTQFKDKSASQSKNINAGLLDYPVLQAADILMYKGALVPVGDDQVQHVELTRVVGRAFNKKYNVEFFPETKPLLTNTPRVKSLIMPEKKMSKSLGPDHVIELADSPEIILKKIKKAVTATSGGGQAPGVENLFMLLKEFGDAKTYAHFVKAEKDKTIRYGELKETLAKIISDYFADFRKKRAELLADESKINKILAEGAKQADIIAKKTMTEVRKIIGL